MFFKDVARVYFLGRGEIVDESIFSNFFKCRQTPVNWCVLLLDGEFVRLLSRWRCLHLKLECDQDWSKRHGPNVNIKGCQPLFQSKRDREANIQGYIFLGVKTVSYHEINQAGFDNRSIKKVTPCDEGVNMSNINLEDGLLFVLCTTLFPTLTTVSTPVTWALSMISRTSSPQRFNMYGELMRDLELYKRSLIVVRKAMVVVGREGKPKFMCMMGCALIFYVFAVENIRSSGADLIGIVNVKMLKRNVIT